jgi:predicted enzyme related to lactoylglutathione lyase
MGNVDTHAPGSFCWIELGTTDTNAARRFYESLLGWSTEEFPTGPSGTYTMFRLGGRDVGGGYALTAEMRAHGLPPHWLLYICVRSADETAEKVAQAGGKLLKDPFDVMDIGRMAVIQDPTGAIFAIWQPKTHQGSGIEHVPGALSWADLKTPDEKRAVKFYEEVFGWDIEPGKDDGGYMHIRNGDKHIGGVPPAAYRNPKDPPHWLVYFLTQDCDTSTAKAKDLGANIFVPPTSMEGVGRWSVLADPQGAVFALFQH